VGALPDIGWAMANMKKAAEHHKQSAGDYIICIICDELTGDFGNGLQATSVGDCGSFRQFAGN
jgi:hypothetical protein